jgi:catechol 2,3-dioxygenase-like lactoylglutathione lyase family enzyme
LVVTERDTTMQKKLFPLIITDHLAETRRFYLEALGCRATFDLDHYLQVRFGEEADAPELAFMGPASAPALGPQKPFAGDGLIVSVPVADAEARHRELAAKRVTIAAPPSDKPWGWRSFVAVDPNGVQLDFFNELADASAADAAS